MKLSTRGKSLVGVFVVIAGFALACGRSGEPIAAPADIQSQGVHARKNVANSYAASALERTKWISELHSKFLISLYGNRKVLAQQFGRSRSGVCAAVIAHALTFAPEFQKYTGVSRSGADLRAYVSRAVHSTPQCSAQRMSVVNQAFAANARIRAVQVDGDSVTGEYDAYESSLESAVSAAGPYTSAVESAVASILNGASSLPAADYDVLAGLGNIAISSSYDWNGLYTGGQLTGCTKWECTEEPMSIFFRGYAIPWVVAIGGTIDLVGAGAAARTCYVGGVRRVGDLVECAGWGALGASGTYLLSLL